MSSSQLRKSHPQPIARCYQASISHEDGLPIRGSLPVLRTHLRFVHHSVFSTLDISRRPKKLSICYAIDEAIQMYLINWLDAAVRTEKLRRRLLPTTNAGELIAREPLKCMSLSLSRHTLSTTSKHDRLLSIDQVMIVPKTWIWHEMKL